MPVFLRSEIMRKRRLNVFIALLAATLLLTLQCKFNPDNPPNKMSASRGAAEAGPIAGDRVLIVLDKGLSLQFKNYTPKDFPEIPCTQVEDLTALTIGLIKKQDEAERTGNWKPLKTHVEHGMLVDKEKFNQVLCLTLAEKGEENVRGAIGRLIKRESILYAGPDYAVSPCSALPDDEYLGNQWAIPNIHLPEAWGIVTGSAEIKIGILDTGIDAEHEDLINRVDRSLSRDFTGAPPAAIPNPPFDHNGHGTMVAGAQGDNEIGIAGACWNVTLVSLRVLDNYGWGYSSYVARAIDFAANNGIDILNLSIRWTSWLQYIMDYYDLALASIINVYPGLFVCAAGNDGGNNNDTNPCYPASYILDNLITVGSIDMNDAPSSFSNVGQATVDIFAPGGSGGFYFPEEENILSTHPDRAYYRIYWYNYGTSFASPYVAGVAALVKSLHPDMTGAELKTAILSAAEPVPALTALCVSGGKLNAYNAVNYIPIVGTADIHFNDLTNDLGVIGTVVFFDDNTCVIAEKGFESYPLSVYLFDEPPAMNQNLFTIGPLPAGLEFSVPNPAWFNYFATDAPYPYYMKYMTWFYISNDNLSVYHWPGVSSPEYVADGAKRRIKIASAYGGCWWNTN
jgi:hypothetical protein